jgi:hypothetical protein
MNEKIFKAILDRGTLFTKENANIFKKHYKPLRKEVKLFFKKLSQKHDSYLILLALMSAVSVNTLDFGKTIEENLPEIAKISLSDRLIDLIGNIRRYYNLSSEIEECLTEIAFISTVIKEQTDED